MLHILLTVFGAILAAITTAAQNAYRRPWLDMEPVPPSDSHYEDGRPAVRARFVRVRVTNRLGAQWTRRWAPRDIAMQCRASVRFLSQATGENPLERTLEMRWAGTPEPVPIPVVIGGMRGYIADMSKMTAPQRRDIHPGRSELLDVAARFDNDDECYAWNNESYFSEPRWRNGNLMLPQGLYLVDMTVETSSARCERTFLLRNDGTRDGFSLEPIEVNKRKRRVMSVSAKVGAWLLLIGVFVPLFVRAGWEERQPAATLDHGVVRTGTGVILWRSARSGELTPEERKAILTEYDDESDAAAALERAVQARSYPAVTVPARFIDAGGLGTAFLGLVVLLRGYFRRRPSS